MISPSESPRAPLQGQSLCHHSYYRHARRNASKCGHDIHPSASKHTPWCPACVASLTRAKLDAVQMMLVAEGGLKPAEYMRDRRWNQARLKHEIAKKRMEMSRKEGQLRWEREQAWDEAHQRYDSQCAQAAAGFQSPAECHVCASMVASYPTNVSKMEIAKEVPWWEQPGALAMEHIVVPRTPLSLQTPPRQQALKPQGSQTLRKIIQNLRASMRAADAQRRMWETRYKTESAIRRKHSLGEGIHFEPDFWDSPISGLISLRNFQQVQDDQRMAARRARGNTPRPKPTRSSLSHSELSEQLQVDENCLEVMREKDELVKLEREVRKVGEEVGYLYFVGIVNGIEMWKEDYLRSDRQLVVRMLNPKSETSESEDSDVGEEDDEMETDVP